ncbi:hypothetical protein [uncultured Thiocystis sp.]|jgi:hypothetical protein|uniref:hypothetical protein n=1 Tax=uncultured Thiocystis sp. TaxID=1202134 RepID=UPI0025D392DF|nr:hypothetical protein [uncultured Thiocystis sp.]
METTSTGKRYSGRAFDAAALDWRKPDGRLKDMSCREALLRVSREGPIKLPAPRRHSEPMRSSARGESGGLIDAPLSALGTVRRELVERHRSG